ncbi:hypothetical protein L198_02050 [Cryptococcus wingfieldii CBS 7118]|uniref:Uncharacterized protein n=1 Tax=Cryptococcus wingfieldii CBS 7118 TaxID=1295528 RepID=A0A1E3JYR9_9TREE|nr:hypothetical protein L198_02050 [Cryptococcus wingfieldii CBS 7118]ODO05357.1 hypothetical protein L198_02050 [Cryptococcus wingfieldii CBS 7118]
MFSNRLVPSFLLALATTLPFSYSAPFDEEVQTLIESRIAASNDHPTLDIRVDDEYSKLQSHNANEGDGEGQKRPYGLLGHGDVEFKFYEPENYKQETFRVSYFEPPTTSAGYQVDDAWETHSATKVIEAMYRLGDCESHGKRNRKAIRRVDKH